MEFLRHTTAVHSRLFSVTMGLCAMGIGLLVGCGPTFKVRPLVGDDQEIVKLIGTNQAAERPVETVSVAKSFYRAVRARKIETMWNLLSTETQQALTKIAEPLDITGRQLLRSRRFPNSKAKGTTRLVSVMALFLVRRPVEFNAVSAPSPADELSQVNVKNAAGKERLIELKREQGQWRIHHPTIDEFPRLTSQKPKLLPWDHVSWTQGESTPKKERPKVKLVPVKKTESTVPKQDNPDDDETSESTQPEVKPDLDF